MNPLLKAKPALIYSEFEATNKLKLPAPYHRNFKLFIDHMLPVFAKIQLYGNADKSKASMSKTLRKIPKEGIEDFSFADIRALIMIAAKVPRSALVKKMGENPKYGSLTPLFMYAHKLYNNIKYSDWDKDDTNIDIALGLFLAKAYEFQCAYPLIAPIDQVTRSSLAGNNKLTAFPMSLVYNYEEDPVDGNDRGEVISHPKEWLIIDCQYWLANVELRDEETMLLDLDEWGRIPPARDATGKQKEKIVDVPDNLDPATCEW